MSAPDESISESLLEALRNHPDFGERFKEAEAIDKEVDECLEFVDISIAYSPIMLDSYDIRDAVDVSYKGIDGRYVIREPFRILNAEEVKLARARYLVLNGRRNQPFIDFITKRKMSARL